MNYFKQIGIKALKQTLRLLDKQTPKTIFNLNEYGIALIKEFEKLRLKSYDDGFGYLTIGWGHTSDKYFKVNQNQVITEEKANELLKYDIEQDAINLLNRELLYEELLDNFQYSALVSLVYNSGSFKIKVNGRWIPSPLMIALNNKEFTKAGELIKSHDIRVRGKVLLGLRRRRLCEYWLYTRYRVNEMKPSVWAKEIRLKAEKLLT